MTAKFDPNAPLTPEEKDLLMRMEGGRVTGVVAPSRIAALRSLSRRGLARCWWGEGRDEGVLLGRMVTGAVVPPSGGGEVA